MKVVLLSTFDRYSGAALACNRLKQALTKVNVDATMMVRQKDGTENNVVSKNHIPFNSPLNFYRFAFERFIFYLHEKSSKIRYNFSLANTGANISSNTLVKHSEIINIHWINQGFLSLDSIKKLAHLNKPIIWTFHDMWAFTGGCHYSGDCKNYLQKCGNCPMLKSPNDNDLSNKLWHKKEKLYKNLNLTIVTLSKWLGQCAAESSLLKNFPVEIIPNAININVFRQIEKHNAIEKFNLPLDKYLILYGTMKISDERKGFYFFKKCLEIFKAKYPEFNNKVELVVFGSTTGNELESLPFKTNYLGTFDDENKIAMVYNAATLFMLPSLDDNLPNTIMESLSCGTPVISFNRGGIPDMVEHKTNGYLADYKSPEDLAEGIKWVIEDRNRYKELCMNARNKVMNNFTYDIVGNKYLRLFEKLLKK